MGVSILVFKGYNENAGWFFKDCLCDIGYIYGSFNLVIYWIFY